MTYNCMARILDDGIGNVTAALKAGGVWDETLMLFAADNGGWNGNTGSSNWPLKGSKVSDFEGGIRAVSFLAGGYVPANLHGTHHTGYIAVADWYGTLCGLVGVSPTDDVPGLPPVDSVDVWPSILVPNANSTGRTEIFLSWSCTASSAAITGCDPTAPSIYNTTGDPTAGQGPGDMGLISGQYKIVIGDQQGRGIWTGPVYPNGTADPHPTPCAEGCLYDIFADPTEHVNLKDTMPSVYTAMMAKLMAHGKTVYQTDYSEPGTEGNCLTGAQARALYAGRNTCIEGSPGYNPSYPRCNGSTVARFLAGSGWERRLPDRPRPAVRSAGPWRLRRRQEVVNQLQVWAGRVGRVGRQVVCQDRSARKQPQRDRRLQAGRGLPQRRRVPQRTNQPRVHRQGVAGCHRRRCRPAGLVALPGALLGLPEEGDA